VSSTTPIEPDEPREITRAPITTFVIGLLAGAVSTFGGVGGWLIVAPALALFLHLRQPRAMGTALMAMLPTAGVAALQYNFGVKQMGLTGLQAPVVLWLAVGGILGAFWGAKLAAAVKAKNLRPVFGGLVAVAGGWMIFLALTHSVNGAELAIDTVRAIAVLGAGIVIGLISGVLGGGGGLVMVPALSLLLGYPQHLAQGTSLAAVLPVTITALLVHLLRRNVAWPHVGPLLLGGMLGAGVVGSAVFKVNGDVLRILFGVLLILVGLRMTRRSPALEKNGRE
jgi:hypothetical protein